MSDRENIQAPLTPVLDQLVKRLVELAHPLRLVLFGSAARAEMGSDSDFDLLVIVEDGRDCRDLAKLLYRRVRGLGCAKDFIVVEESDVEKFKNDPSLIIHTALQEGKELYRAPQHTRESKGLA